MKRNKRGISLIVLVITIIVMIVLASVIIISLNNSGIIDKANEGLDKTNLNQIQTLVATLWADAYLDPTIITDEDYREYIVEELKKNEINLNEYVYEITSKGASVEGPDLIKPTITFIADKQGIGVGGTLTYTVTFGDNNEVATVDFDAGDVTITGFTAGVTVTGEGNTRTLIFGNIQGELGEKTVTIAAGVAKDVAGNTSNATTVKFSIVETLGALITSAEMYGTKINYEANGVNDWKVFYTQAINGEEYVYLIASEELAYSAYYDANGELTELGTKLADSGATVTSKTVEISDEITKAVGKVYWSEEPVGIAVVDDAKNKWLAEWSNYSAEPNGKAVSYLLDENIWKSFCNVTKYRDTNGNSYVVGAIGTPTAEMFVASWNAIREATGNTTKYNKKLKLEPNETIGYYVNDITNGETTTNVLAQLLSTRDPLYIWSTAANATIWLASPSGCGTSSLLAVYNNANFSYYSYSNKRCGVRPVVCLKSNIPAKLVDGNIEI